VFTRWQHRFRFRQRTETYDCFWYIKCVVICCYSLLLHRDAVCIFYLVLRALDTVEDDVTIPADVKSTMLRNFHTYLLDPDWKYMQSTEKDRIVLEDFPVVCWQHSFALMYYIRKKPHFCVFWIIPLHISLCDLHEWYVHIPPNGFYWVNPLKTHPKLNPVLISCSISNEIFYQFQVLITFRQGWQVSAEGGLNRGLNRSGRNRFLPVSANGNFQLSSY